jgi:hypothetical protein
MRASASGYPIGSAPRARPDTPLRALTPAARPDIRYRVLTRCSASRHPAISFARRGVELWSAGEVTLPQPGDLLEGAVDPVTESRQARSSERG